ncbi:MAG: HAD-IA family hydrolase [Chloroflexota bacterium]|nr:HAD-IA family hydrolase [Chloroflexota bacterium]
MQKPEPRFHALARERPGVQPAEVVFLDDVEVCAAAAREFGMRAILFRDTAQAIADIQACLEADGQRR